MSKGTQLILQTIILILTLGGMMYTMLKYLLKEIHEDLEDLRKEMHKDKIDEN